MLLVPHQGGESWRVYTKRLAKLNHTNRRRILKWMKRRGLA
jgi:hypothetical protein